MFMKTSERIAIYSLLFKEGAVAVKKDTRKESHDQIPVKNLFVMKEMLSLKSRGFVRETYNWRWSYYFLTDEGVEFLRRYLHLPAEIVPETHMKQAPGTRPALRSTGFGRGEKNVGAEGGFKPTYRREGGFGRGARDQ